MRKAELSRKTNETDIAVSLCIDGTGTREISTGVGFLDHMLEQLARHSLMDIKITVSGDVHIDDHHTTEDSGWALGQAFKEALGDRRGITRYGSSLLPMDETMSQVAVDLSGRPFLVCRVAISNVRNHANRIISGMVSGIFNGSWYNAACGKFLWRKHPSYN